MKYILLLFITFLGSTFQVSAQIRLLGYTQTPVTCFEETDGSITISGTQIEGGTPGYTYSIGDNNDFRPADQTFDNLGQGSYTITIRDSLGTQLVFGEVTVQGPEEITLLGYTMKEVTCFEESDGSITISANQVDGGRPGTDPRYTYSIGDLFQNIGVPFENLGQGSYTVTIQDGANCQKVVGEVTVQGPEEITLLGYTMKEVTCFEESDGSITISANQVDGGRPGTDPRYTYSIGDLFQNIGVPFENLGQGSYTVTIQDGVNCQKVVGEVTVQGPEKITLLGYTQTPVTCFGGKDGTITISANQVDGGRPGTDPPYTYAIEDNNDFKNVGIPFENLEQGSYTVTIQDGVGCQKVVGEVTVQGPQEIRVVDLTLVPVSCNGGNDGNITLFPEQIIGGFAPYTYSLGQEFIPAGLSFTDLEAGFYNVTIQDANKCTTFTIGIEVPEPSHIEIIRVVTTPANCPEFNDGTLCIDTHSNTSLEYSINDGLFQNSPVFTDLEPGIYDIIVRQRGVDNVKCAVDSIVIDRKFAEFTGNDIGNFILRKYCPGCIEPS